MNLTRLAFKNAFRTPIRSLLTILGIAIALMAFFMIQTLLIAWESGTRQASVDRLVTRNAISLVVHLPVAYQTQIEKIPNIIQVGRANWFGGIYRDEQFGFGAQFAVDENYLKIYQKEYTIDEGMISEFNKNPRTALIGEDTAKKYNLTLGSRFNLRGTIFEGDWEFIVGGVFKAKAEGKDSRIMFFPWKYLNETNRVRKSRPADQSGIFVSLLAPDANPTIVGESIDALFANSYAETLTESETAFVRSFVSMSSTILSALRAVSLVVIPIMLLVLSNTMLMSSRERYREYSVLMAIGFSSRDLLKLLLTESLIISTSGLSLLIFLIVPTFIYTQDFILGNVKDFFPQFEFSYLVASACIVISILIGIASGVIPWMSVKKIKPSEGIRAI